MDERTLGVYDRDAAAIAARHRAGAHERLHEALLGHFLKGRPTADIGAGSGRDTIWLIENGFPAVAYEPSTGMRGELAAAYPGIDVREAALPALDGIPDSSYVNVLCAAVLMHLPAESLSDALRNLARITEPGGRLALTYRTSQTGTDREPDGRLFSPIDSGEVIALLAVSGVEITLTETEEHPRQPGATWTLLLGEKVDPPIVSR
jgi:SAM-dependent methyltransferase